MVGVNVSNVILFKVQFMSVSVVAAIQTQGRYSTSINRWVFTYRVEYSQDCVTFTRLLDGNGNDQVRSFLICL